MWLCIAQGAAVNTRSAQSRFCAVHSAPVEGGLNAMARSRNKGNKEPDRKLWLRTVLRIKVRVTAHTPVVTGAV
eukprot:2984056-Amphidinium_carterae.1